MPPKKQRTRKTRSGGPPTPQLPSPKQHSKPKKTQNSRSNRAENTSQTPKRPTRTARKAPVRFRSPELCTFASPSDPPQANPPSPPFPLSQPTREPNPNVAKTVEGVIIVEEEVEEEGIPYKYVSETVHRGSKG